MVREFRREDDATPIVLMGYLNPILSYGAERFCADAAAAGVDGLIMVDLPTEEADMLVPQAAAHGIDIIRLVAPTTDDERLPLVLNGSSGFVYYVSITGITGTRSTTAEHLARGDPAHPARHRSADRRRLRRALAGAGGRGGARRRCRRGRLGAVQHDRGECSGKPELVRSVLDQVRELAGRRAWRRGRHA